MNSQKHFPLPEQKKYFSDDHCSLPCKNAAYIAYFENIKSVILI